ncbi:MAG: hypothetical protein AAB316_01080 [Bacteroidota bacterium]
MTRKFNLYLGKAGQFIAMAEFLSRGWNVAVPEVDVGDDVFVVRDADGEFARVQVKSSSATRRNNGFSAQFSFLIDQLEHDFSPELTYVLLAKLGDDWQKPLIIPRIQLFQIVEKQKIGNKAKGNLILYLSFKEDKVTCSTVDFSPYLNNFEAFPIIVH